tara:strand:+ start:5298 stop:5774 length:477 start_codon:yes stop_codon:yes gene_type:complete
MLQIILTTIGHYSKLIFFIIFNSKMNYKYILIIFFLFNLIGKSQEDIQIQYMDPKTENMIKFMEIKNSNKQLIIYSIQLTASEKLQTITKIKNQYNSLFPNEMIDEIFEPPYFKLIIGCFLDKKNAEKKLESIRRKFQSSFILKREISIEKFEEFQNK